MTTASDLIEQHFGRHFCLIDKSTNDGDKAGPSSLPPDVHHWKAYLKRQAEEGRAMRTVMNKISAHCSDEAGLRKWRLHTHTRHLLNGLPNVLKKKYSCDIASQAFCKFYEILTRYPHAVRSDEKGSLRSLHLCEAPGNFIAGLNYFLAIFHPLVDWTWLANSLNPHYEGTRSGEMLLTDDLIVAYPDNWYFGLSNSGDVTKMAPSFGPDMPQYCFVTADGSCYTQDQPEAQESTVFPIVFAEVDCALRALYIGGTFILKMYSHFGAPTSRLLVALMRSFESVSIVKPAASKSGNAERYAVCIRFRGTRWLGKKKLETWMEGGKGTREECERLLSCSSFFSRLQRDAIQANLDEFESPTIDKEALETARSKAVGRLLSTMRAQLLQKAASSPLPLVSLHDSNGKNPWKKLHSVNYVEELKGLEDRETAEEYIRERLRSQCMNFGDASRSDEEKDEETLEVEWSPEELEWIKPVYGKRSPVVHYPFLPLPRLLHSIFVDLRLWKAVVTLRPGSVRDMCPWDEEQSIDPDPVEIRARGEREARAEEDGGLFEPDENGTLAIRVDALASHSSWIRLLKRLARREEGGEGSVSCLRLLLPMCEVEGTAEGEGPSPRTLLLSRFSVSVISLLSVLFFRIRFNHPRSGVIAEFTKPNYAEDLPDGLDSFLEITENSMRAGIGMYLTLVPSSFFSDFHPFVVTFNSRQLNKIIENIRI